MARSIAIASWLLGLIATETTTTTTAFVVPDASFVRSSAATTTTSLSAISRADFVRGVFAGVATSSLVSFPAFADEGETVKLSSGLVYKVEQVGTGPKPEVGELAGIRFKATCGANVIDDIFGTPEPYYTRIGAGNLLKGVEEVLPLMRVGDRYELTIPSNLAFGPKGRPASAGKPRIPGDATIIFVVEVVSLPGREQELIDIIGDV